MAPIHTFHIPVMGIGYTIDTPIKVAHLGIDSVISLVDDILMEKLREMYCRLYNLPYSEITEKTEDFRAKRITSYLNMVKELAERKFDEFKMMAVEKGNEIKEYFHMLPDSSTIKEEFKKLTDHINLNDVKSWIRDNLPIGSIDVNIMTKVDKDNYLHNEKLPVIFNDAHAALRGYANSDLSSSLVLSAGMSPRLYSYLEQFEDFFPTEDGKLKKKIALKVSDYRSALIQGKFLAKKGLWVSEYRVESGLNCGGHAFATDGFLMGPILAEFRDNREELIQEIYPLWIKGLEDKGRAVPKTRLPLIITAQGGVGTAEEHQFLVEHYGVTSVGWGTPFLLVPEATTVDDSTLHQLADAKEDDLYLSNISPLGIPFNSLRGNSKDVEKNRAIDNGKPGSNCPKKFIALNKEFTERGICPASRQYQRKKIKELDGEGLSSNDYLEEYNRIVDKSCICVGLGTSNMLANKMNTDIVGTGVSVCPGPNLAYFSKIMSIKEMTDHIYGRANHISRNDRPNFFINELKIYLNYLKDKIDETKVTLTQKQEKYLCTFSENLDHGISYYQNLFGQIKDKFQDTKTSIFAELDNCKRTLSALKTEIKKLAELPVSAQ